MFLPDDFAGNYGLHEVSRAIHPEMSKLTPQLIEFLDCQTSLLPGTVYLSTESDAAEYFAAYQPQIIGFPLLVVCNAIGAKLVCPDTLSKISFSNPVGHIFNCLTEYLDLSGVSQEFQDFGTAWKEITSRTQSSTPEVWELLKGIESLVKPFAQVAVFSFVSDPQKTTPLRLIAKQLQQSIPHSAVSIQGGEILMLITYENRRFDYPIDRTFVLSILEKYNGYMAISNGSRDLTNLDTIYYLTRRLILLANSMELLPNERIYTFERLGMYLVIDLCSRGVPSGWKNDYIMYLAHPAAVALKRYDNETQENLCDVLYFYLSTNCSVTESAALLHMHRNSVANKVKKISSVFTIDLSDRHLRQRLLFSLQILLYNGKFNLKTIT